MVARHVVHVFSAVPHERAILPDYLAAVLVGGR